MNERTEVDKQGNRAAGLAGQEWGEGTRAVLVHGSISTGAECWEAQRPLADQGFQLSVPDRRGYGASAGDDGEDFLRDAEDVAELLGESAHLVGHSYGGVAALLAAKDRPEAVRSLAVVEPPAFGLVTDHPAVAELTATLRALFEQTELDDSEFLEAFLGAVGTSAEELPGGIGHWAAQVGPLRRSRPPWEAEIPLDELRANPFPKLVVSGGHNPAFDAVCDELTRGLDAENMVIRGAGHEAQMVAEPFNEALLRLWRSAEVPA